MCCNILYLSISDQEVDEGWEVDTTTKNKGFCELSTVLVGKVRRLTLSLARVRDPKRVHLIKGKDNVNIFAASIILV